METLEQQFNSRVRVFLGLTGVSPTTFGMKALGDPNLMRQLDGGRSLSLRTADRVLAFVADYDLDSGGPRTPPRGHRRPEAFVTGEENEEEQSDDRRATYGRTGVRKRRGGPMRTLALRRCARVLRSKPRHGHVLRLRGRVGQRRTGSTDRDGSDPPVRGPGTGSEAGVFAHPCRRPLGVAPGQLSLRGKAVQRRFEAAEHQFDRRSRSAPRAALDTSAKQPSHHSAGLVNREAPARRVIGSERPERRKARRTRNRPSGEDAFSARSFRRADRAVHHRGGIE